MWKASVRIYFIDTGDSYTVFGFGFKVKVCMFEIHFACLLCHNFQKESTKRQETSVIHHLGVHIVYFFFFFFFLFVVNFVIH